jgi:RNA polymerase subunit RPABC4/transcription elongation factor Spt4
MIMVCKQCQHLMEENHECPSEEYIQFRNELFRLAILANVTEESEEEVIKNYEKEIIQKQAKD